ncbi:MAG: DUF2851 family protein [Calditrichaeota bacterium]|nr:DUF2851 family protein [Calditrichota bacterium]
MQEYRLYTLWKSLSRTHRVLEFNGRRLRVLHPGQLNLSRGPDFTSACFELDNVRITGDVEMHVRLNDWYLHRHHLDPFYKNVALHVVLKTPSDDADRVFSDVSRRNIPTFFIDREEFNHSPEHPAMRCTPPSTIRIDELQKLSLQRLNTKIRYFQHSLQAQAFEQVFYEHFFRVLGYPRNQASFRLLAQHLNWGWLERNWSQLWIGEELLYGLYAGQAGFLPQSSADAYVNRLIFFYREFRNLLPSSGLTPEHWQFSGVRPCNHPHFRLAAWVALILQHKQLPANALWETLSRREPEQELYKKLLRFFSIPARGYWATHYILQKSNRKNKRKMYFGTARIHELLVNLIIPLFSAQALLQGSLGFADYLREVYLWIPACDIYRSFRKFFPWLVRYQTHWKKQALLQGFIQLDAGYCQVGACYHCPLQHIVDKIS